MNDGYDDNWIKQCVLTDLLATAYLPNVQEEHLTTYFEKVLIYIKRGIYSVHFKEMNLFKKLFFEKGALFLPASWAVIEKYLKKTISNPMCAVKDRKMDYTYIFVYRF